MDAHLQPNFKLVALWGLLLPLLFLFFPTASHASNTGCGEAVCYVDTTVRGESNWQDYMDDTTSTTTGGTVTPKDTASFYTACDTWLPVGGGSSTHSYPVQNSGSMACHFKDGGAYSTGNGEIWFVCPPSAGRASNGRLTYLVKGVNSAGESVWVYARYRCLYPTDAYAPTERLLGSGKVYTGGQADFYQTESGSQAQQPIRTGTQTDTSGYINRGVDLNNPEAWAGSWSPSFTARTGTTATGDPLYGYYRLLWNLDYRTCVKYGYPAWLHQPLRYDCSHRGTDITVSPYTYACDANPPLQAGIRDGAKFKPADCVPAWSCSVQGSTTIADQAVALAVMRNGEPLPVRFATPTVNVSDPSRVRDVRAWKIRNTPTPGATPDAGKYTTTSWWWGSWEAFKQDGQIAFHWASASGSPFSWTSEFKFTADFLVPAQTSPGDPVRWVWVASTENCTSTGSPAVDVLRAVNK